MKLPSHITFTGIDDRTDLARADKLANEYPIEWGILLSKSNRDARYPCDQAIREISKIKGNKAAHVCGEYAQQLLQIFPFQIVSFPGDQIDERIKSLIFDLSFDRVQINSKSYPPMEVKTFSGLPLIKQWRSSTFDEQESMLMLYDCSGGRGILPTVLPRLLKDKFVGYAGGITPENVLTFLNNIEGKGEFWIDMETGVRTNGWFDLNKVEKICQLVYG